MKLSARSEDIIRLLLRFPMEQPVTIAVIAEELGSSPRSIQRELPHVESWLKSEGFSFVRKRSVGLYLAESEERKAQLLSILDALHEKPVHAPEKESRTDVLKQMLLYTDEPVKAFAFTDRLGISEGTLFSDLDALELWFAKYHLKISRRPGSGISLTGTESARRLAAAAFLYERTNQMHFHGRIPSAASLSPDINTSETVKELLDYTSLLLTESEEKLGLKLSDNGYLRLYIYLTYSVRRTLEGHPLENEDKALDLSSEPEFAVADYLLTNLSQKFAFQASPTDKSVLTTYLTGIRIWPEERKDLTVKRNFDIHSMTLALIAKVGDFFGSSFDYDTKLPTELAAHVQPTIGRLRAGIPIDNPLLEEFQITYPELYHACELGAASLSGEYELPVFPPSEIGFITIYFAMSLERKKSRDKMISVILVCPTGIVSSRLLAANLQKEYPELDIRGTISAFNIDTQKLAEYGVELIISTVKLETDFNWICVNPILNKQDRILLDSRLKAVMENRMRSAEPYAYQYPIPRSPLSKSDVEYISRLGEEIYHVMDNIRIGYARLLKDRDDLISRAATLFADSSEMEEHLYQVLKERDQLADTYMKPFHALLLHGKSSRVDHACFGYIQLEPPLYENAHVIFGAMISIIPENPENDIAAPISSEIVGAMLENPEMLKALRSADGEHFQQMLEVSLLRFYKNCVLSTLT